MKKFVCFTVSCLCFLTTACADYKTAKIAAQSGDYATARMNLT